MALQIESLDETNVIETMMRNEESFTLMKDFIVEVMSVKGKDEKRLFPQVER